MRPFWGIAARYYGGTALTLYLTAVVSIFAFLRTIGYPISVVHLALPPLWHRVGESRGWFFLKRGQQAFAAGRTAEGLLYLTNAYEFDPTNYELGLMLAKTYQIGQPRQSDDIYRKLLENHPERRNFTAQQWMRALVARGDFEQIVTLATAELRRDPTHANAWMRALIFATRQAHDDDAIAGLAKSDVPLLALWRPLLETELLLRSHHPRAAGARVRQPWPANSPPYTVVYRAETLADLEDPVGALDFLVSHRARLDDEAYWTVRLHCLAVAGATQTLRGEFGAVLLDQPLTQPRLKMMCAQLIRHPDATLIERVFQKVDAARVPLNDDTAGGWFSLLCVAGVAEDHARVQALTAQLRHATSTPFTALTAVEAYFRGHVPEASATSFLPVLPVPLEVAYALIERYPGREGGAMKFVEP